jgi:hypothetical protein
VEDPTLDPIALMAPTPEGDRIFSSRFVDFAVALDHATKAATESNGEELARTEAALTAPDVPEALGAKAGAALSELVSAAKSAARATGEDEPSIAALDLATARLDNALLGGRLPYFADSNVIINMQTGARLVLLYGFGIVSTDVYRSADARVRVVRVHRLDRLNWSHTLLGLVNPHRAQAMVLLDQIEEELVDLVLVALADGAPMPLLPLGEVGDADGDTIQMQAGADLRSDVADLPGIEAASARELGEALAGRRALFVKWNEQARARGLSLKFPAHLAFDAGALERASAGMLPASELRELRRWQERLARTELKRVYDVFSGAFTASVERHEVQHRLDLIRPIPMLERIDSILPPGRGAASDRIRDKIRSETSAYLAQLARDDRLTRSTFSRLMQFLVNPATRGTPESYVALILLEELGSELDAAVGAPLLHDHRFDIERIARAHKRIVSLPREKLRSAAARTWSRLFRAELAPLTAPGQP